MAEAIPSYNGKITFVEGKPVFEATTGLGSVTTGLLTISPQTALVGLPKIINEVRDMAIGNVIGIHSATGKVGVGAAGYNVSFG